MSGSAADTLDTDAPPADIPALTREFEGRQRKGGWMTAEEIAETRRFLADGSAITLGADAAIAKHSRFHELIEKIVATHDAKNRDYADSNTDPLRNFRRCEEVGIPAHVGCFVRMGDKFMRMENLLRRMQAGGDGPAVKAESIIDTAEDLAVYALIFIELIEQYLESARVPSAPSPYMWRKRINGA